MNKILKKLIENNKFEVFIESALKSMELELDSVKGTNDDKEIKNYEDIIKYGKEIKESISLPIFNSKKLFTMEILNKTLGNYTINDVDYIQIEICTQEEFPPDGVTEWAGIMMKDGTFNDLRSYCFTNNLLDTEAVWNNNVKVKDIIPCFDPEVLEYLNSNHIPVLFEKLSYDDDIEDYELKTLKELIEEDADISIGQDWDT